METTRVLTLALCALLAPATDAAVTKLPNYLKACSRSDPNLNACSLKSAIAAIPSLVIGDPSLHIPPVDPLRLDKVVVEQGNGPVKIMLILTQMYLHGLKHTDLKAMDFDLDKKRVEARFLIPGQATKIESKYEIDGQVLILPIKGHGDLTLKLDNLNATFRSAYDLEKLSDGKEHMRFKDNSFDFDVTKVYLHFENLFNGDKVLGDNMNLFLNENWQDVYKEIKPAVVEVVRTTLIHILTEVTSALPYDVMFPV